MHDGPKIPKSECKDRRLYRIRSRNLRLGVYRAKTGGFLGLRTKFGSTFVFEEFHWDNGEPYGTVLPQEELPDELPPHVRNEESLGTACSKCGAECEYAMLSVGADPPGRWRHTSPTECQDPHPSSLANRALHEWLKEAEEKYPHA